MFRSLFTAFLLFAYLFATAQRIDSLPFSLNRGLLTIKGSINQVDVDFILDTGAGITVTTHAINKKANVKTLRKKLTIRDANNATQKLEQIKIQQITVGSFEVADLEAVTFDMPYMDCQQLLLLGQDFMHRFNWKFDFENQMVYISDKPFQTGENMMQWDINFVKKRPFISYDFGNKRETCLIDFGYRGFFDINASFSRIDSTLKAKEKEGKVISYSAMVMGLATTKKEQPVQYILVDSMSFSNQPVYNIPVSVSNYKGAKIGLQFFTSFFRQLIINNSERKYYFQMKIVPDYAQSALDAGVSWEEGKLIVSDLNTGTKSSAGNLKIGEEIKAIDGRTAADFGSFCNVLTWRFGYSKPDLWIEKMDGTKVLIRRQSVLDFAK
jgi:hypothetical protein